MDPLAKAKHRENMVCTSVVPKLFGATDRFNIYIFADQPLWSVDKYKT